jgi:hypothetical protein
VEALRGKKRLEEGQGEDGKEDTEEERGGGTWEGEEGEETHTPCQLDLFHRNSVPILWPISNKMQLRKFLKKLSDVIHGFP